MSSSHRLTVVSPNCAPPSPSFAALLSCTATCLPVWSWGAIVRTSPTVHGPPGWVISSACAAVPTLDPVEVIAHFEVSSAPSNVSSGPDAAVIVVVNVAPGEVAVFPAASVL